jgi:hypothetical protein
LRFVSSRSAERPHGARCGGYEPSVRRDIALIPVALVVGVVALVAAGRLHDDDNSAAGPEATPAAGVEEASGRRGAFGRIPTIVDEVVPSVVAILVETERAEGEGSGVIWNADGIIVTNNHVVEGAREIEVAFASGERPTRCRGAGASTRSRRSSPITTRPGGRGRRWRGRAAPRRLDPAGRADDGATALRSLRAAGETGAGR